MVAACVRDVAPYQCPGYDCPDAGNDVSNPDGFSSDSDGGADQVVNGCDRGKSPKDEPCLVSEDHAVFVDSAKGDDANAGTKAAPKKTINVAIAAAKASGKRALACEGIYVENVVLDATNSANLNGGFECGTWKYDASKKVEIKPASGIPLTVRAVTTALVIEDMSFLAPNGAQRGDSSIAVFVAQAKDAKFRRVVMKAGKGQDGIDQSMGSNYSGATAPSGNAPSTGTGGTPGSITCTNGNTSSGGKGGDGVLGGGGNGTGGTANPPASDAIRTGSGGTGGVAGCGTGSISGADGAARTAAAGATRYGTLDANGWTPAAGADALAGNPGQGGGGGGGKTTPSTGGGGGGAGGCGGAGGKGGGGSGSSFALASHQSFVTLEACTLETDDAGRGGNGAPGQPGQAGAAGYGDADVCGGARGGNGSGGPGGGGGAGGLSVAIAYTGNAPTKDDATQTTTKAAGGAGGGGTGGAGGTNVLSTAPSGPNGGAGKVGLAAPVLDVQ
jgi:hypothetical protein